MNSEKRTLHLVSFDIPYPPNYGGVIDVFYKIKNLNELGIDIILHCFEYGRKREKELEKHCKEVNYYKRETEFKSLLSRTPYIVKSRESNSLVKNLLKDNYPVLFEGLHTTHPLTTGKFNHRKTLVRTHNIEHNYYNGLRNSESNLSKKVFFKLESIKLKAYEKSLNRASHILTISPYEHAYFKKYFGDKASYTPVFFDYQKNKNTPCKQRFSLWHGDLSVADNVKSLEYIIDIYKTTNYELVVASSHISQSLVEQVSQIKNISLKKIEVQNDLQVLIEQAHIHPLVSFQKTGIKLRLLNILSQGKHIIANNNIIEGTGLEECVYRANDSASFMEKISMLMEKDFTQKEILNRDSYLEKFNPKNSAQTIIDLLQK